MTSFQKTIKYCAMFFAVFLAISIIASISGVIIGGVSALIPNNHTRNKVLQLEEYNHEKYFAIFSSQTIELEQDEVFRGTDLNTVFGSVTLDLREAIINEDVTIDVRDVFGGIEIFLPDDINVKVSGTPIFGSITSKRKYIQSDSDKPTIYVDAVSVFGGVDIK